MTSRAWTESLGTLSNSAVDIPARPMRRGLIISNNSDTVMTVRPGGEDATAAAGISIPPSTALRLSEDELTLEALSLFCAGSSKAYAIYER